MPQWMDRLHALAPSRLPRTASVLVTTALVLGGMAWYLTHRTLVWTCPDPTGQFTAICSYRTYLADIPMMPGQGSDKPCFVKVVDRKGRSLGEIRVLMLQMAELKWTPQGAEIKLVGEWDFATRTCRRW